MAHADSVLSIQSTVVFGYVGNKSSMFPMQLHGFDVSPVNSCQFSNHTGYPSFTGARTSGDELMTLADGLEKSGIMNFAHVITGYLASVSFLESTIELVKRLKTASPSTFFLCDPVLGDEGKMYVPKEFVALYRDRLIQFADVLTPNQTEAELLSGKTIVTLRDALTVCQWFHSLGIKTVIITSCTLQPESDAAGTSSFSADPNRISVIASTIDSSLFDRSESVDASAAAPSADAPVSQHFCMSLPKRPYSYSGTGDLSAALLLVWLRRDRCLRSALEKCMASVKAIVDSTFAANSRELLLVQGKKALESPPELPEDCHAVHV